MPEWQLRFEAARLQELAARYHDAREESALQSARRASEAGQFSFEDFLNVCRWKTRRSASRCRKNTPEEVAEITRVALSASAESLRIGVLRCLRGVDWPTASVLLHLAHTDPYPILDVRAIWSLGFDKPPTYSFDFWWRYVRECRALARKHDVDMRTLDKALWQYSKEKQGKFK